MADLILNEWAELPFNEANQERKNEITFQFLIFYRYIN